MSSGTERYLESKDAGVERAARPDEEWNTMLARSSAEADNLVGGQQQLKRLRDALYERHLRAVDLELHALGLDIRNVNKRIEEAERGLRSNEYAREVERRVREITEAQRIAEIIRGERITALRERLTAGAQVLKKDRSKLSKGLADVFERTVEDPNFDQISNGRIRVTTQQHGSVRIMAEGPGPVFCMAFNPPSQSEIAKAVFAVTAEAQNYVGAEGEEVVRDFIGFRVDASVANPFYHPYALVKGKRGVSDMLLPVGPSGIDRRFDLPLDAITHIVRHGYISFQTLSGVRNRMLRTTPHSS